jgi:hypothetical protein
MDETFELTPGSPAAVRVDQDTQRRRLKHFVLENTRLLPDLVHIILGFDHFWRA